MIPGSSTRPPWVSTTRGVTSGPLWERATASILAIDGDAHSRVRRLVAKAFSPRAITRLQSLVAQTAAGLVDTWPRPGTATSSPTSPRPYPTPIICALLGAPPQDWLCSRDGPTRS